MTTEPINTINIGDELQLTLESNGDNEEVSGKFQDQNIVTFGGIAGERVTAKIARIHRSRIEAHVIEVLKGSEHRVKAPCPIFWPCTGCEWQHIKYSHQLALKHSIVRKNLNKFPSLSGVLVAETLPSPNVFGYRNHARFTVGRNGNLGFVNKATKAFVPVSKCLLMHDSINETLESLQGYCSETSQLSIRYGVNSGSLLIQPKLSNFEINVITGQKYYYETLHGQQFRVGSPSFFQVNTPQAEAMIDIAKTMLKTTGEEILVDAYAGVGVFAALLAPFVQKVFALEESGAAIKDSRENLGHFANVESLQGRVEDLLPNLAPSPDLVLLDPPRAGCHPRTLQALSNSPPRRILYVSCDPETLSRDLAILAAGPFKIEKVQPIDLFPQTHHVECMVSMFNYELEAPV